MTPPAGVAFVAVGAADSVESGSVADASGAVVVAIVGVGAGLDVGAAAEAEQADSANAAITAADFSRHISVTF